MEEDGDNPPIGVLNVGDVEFEEQPPDVGLDGPFAEDQPLGDTSVRHPLRHQPEYLVLALGELTKAVQAGIPVEERGNHLRGRARSLRRRLDRRR